MHPCFKQGLLIAALITALPASAQETRRYMEYRTGTGFFVSQSGHIVTNEHVVKGCMEVTIAGSVPESEAEVIATDVENDLAIIRTQAVVPWTAGITDNEESIEPGEKALVIGYPGDSAMTLEYKVVETKVLDVKGPTGEPKWIQFENSAQQGNSGGPLLDQSGNVIGVIMGKSTLFRVNQLNGSQEFVREADVAISLPYLKKFLSENSVYFRRLGSAAQLANYRIEDQAKQFIVTIRCKLGETSE